MFPPMRVLEEEATRKQTELQARLENLQRRLNTEILLPYEQLQQKTDKENQSILLQTAAALTDSINLQGELQQLGDRYYLKR